MIEGSNVKLSSAHPTRTLRKSVQRFHTDLQVVFQQQAWTFFPIHLYWYLLCFSFWVHSAAQERLVIGQDGFD